MKLSADLPNDRILVHVEIQEDVAIVKATRLPTGWNSLPYNRHTQEVFAKFCKEEKAAVLQVPSAVVPSEYNFIINPLHKDFSKIKVKKVEKFSFDERLMR